MKNEKLKKIIATALTSTIISTIVPVAASAEWLKNSENNWAWMENGNGITGWKQVEGAWYYFDNDGNMKTGWIQTSDSKWYYMNPEGAMKTGWLQLADGKWYNLAPTGEMKTGWIQESDGKWYNLAPTGEMKTGWIQESGGNWYFANSSGVMQTGVIQVEGKAYVLGESGAMLIGKNVLFEEKGYTTDSSGVIIEGNSSNDHREFTKDGVLITSNANSGTEKTPTAVGNSNTSSQTSSSSNSSSSKQSIKKIESINDMEVEKGTELDEVKLPGNVDITLSNNKTITVAVIWDKGNPIYDKSTAGTYRFYGTITLPTGVINSGNLKASINVNVKESDNQNEEEITLSSVEQLDDIDVEKGTELDEAELPNSVQITLSNNTTTSAAVIWNEGNPTYDENTTGTYIFIGKIKLPEGVTNPNNLKVSIKVNVKESGNEEEITLSSVEQLNDIDVEKGIELDEVDLPNNVDIILSNSITTSAAVTWNEGNPTYDENRAGTYIFIGKIKLPEGVTNPNNLKASVKVNVKENEEQKIVTNVETINDISVANGTELNAAGLPNSVNVTLNDGTITSASISWDLASANYDKNAAGTYTFNGTIILPTGVTNPNGLNANVTIKVEAPVVEDKTVTNVETINDITVANGTELNAAGLPNSVNVTLNDGTITSASVLWDLSSANYDKNTAGTYTFNGTLILPTGVTNPNNLTTTVKVNVENKTISDVQVLDDISVANGTELNAVALPNTVNITLSDTTIVAADVTWDLAGANYDKNTVGTYALTGTITLPNGVTNPGNLTASVNVKVEGKTVNSIEQLSDIGVANGTQLNAIAFPSNVNVTLSDGTIISVTVTWDKQSSNYNGYANGTYTFTGTLNLPTDVSNSNNLSVYLKVIVQQAIIQSPFATTVDSLGNVYVGGLNGGSIIKYNSNGIYQSTINSGLSSVWGLMTTSSGDMYISGGGDGRILKYKSNGVISEVPITYDYFSPTQIASDSLGNFYVANEYNAEVIKFDSNWQYVSRLSTNNNGWGTYAVAIDKDNNIYTASDNGIIKMSSDGMNQTTFYSNSLNSGYYYGESYGMAFNSKGNLYVSNNNGYNGYVGEVIVINPSGELIQTITGTGTQNFSGLITGLAIDSEDNLYVADYSNSNVMKFDRNGNYIRTLK